MGKINYAKSEGGGFELLPEGTFDFQITGITQGVSKNKGTPQVEVDLEVVDGDYAGKTMKAWYYITDASAWKLNKLATVCGVPQIDSGQVNAKGEPILESDTDDFLDAFFRADVKHEEYEKKVRAKIENEEPSPFSQKGAAPAATAAKVAAAGAAAAPPSAAGAPIAQRRPRPVPAS